MRVINVDLEKLARRHPLYSQRKREMPDPNVQVERIDPNLNLPETCRTARMRMAIRAYEEVLPLIVSAARKGKSYLIIKDEKVLHDAEITLDLLSVLLFQHGVYKIQINTSYKEFTIMITKNAFNLTTQYINTDYDDSATSGTEEPETTLSDPLLDSIEFSRRSLDSDTFSRIMGRIRNSAVSSSLMRGSTHTLLGPLPPLQSGRRSGGDSSHRSGDSTSRRSGDSSNSSR